MNTLKRFFIGIFLFSIPIMCKGQSIKIHLDHDKTNNALTLKISNSTDKEILIMNQTQLKDLGGSYIVLTRLSDNKQYSFTIPLFVINDGKWITIKSLPANGAIDLTYPFDSIPTSNVIKAHLILVTLTENKTTGKVTKERYEKEISIQ